MLRLQTLEIPISRLQAHHNCSEAKKKDSQEANGLHSYLYLAKVADVMLTSHLRTPVGLQSGARGKVLGFFCTNLDGP